MSKLAQAVEQAVREMRASRQPKERRRRMTDDEIAEELAKAPAQSTADPVTTEPTEGATDMATKKKARRSKKATKAKGERKVRAKRVAKAAGEGRVLKTYRLVDGIPDEIRKGSAGLKILEAIKDHGSPTRNELRAALPKSFKDNTLRSFLGEFQREKIVASK